MKFTVHVMPPPTTASDKPTTPLKTLSFPIDSALTFKQLWKVTEQRFREAYDKDKLAGMYFSHIQDLEGGTLFMTDTIGSLYPENGPTAERQLFMCMQDVDREGTEIPAGSDLRPRGFQKRRWEDLDEAEQASVKRRRKEEERYGTTLDKLDPDTPLMSREAGNGGLAGMNSARPEEPAESSRVDTDGFRVPAKPIKSVSRPRTSAVLVHSSQNLPTPESADRHVDDDTPNPTPPSAQRPPESPESEDIIASSQSSQSAFERLGIKSVGASSQKSSTKKVTWSPAQDDILRQGYRETWGSRRISQALGGRSEGAVRARKKLLQERGELVQPFASVVSQGNQSLELGSYPPVSAGSTAPRSSVPVASQSTAPRSSPCEAAAVAKQQSSIPAPPQKRKRRSSQKRPIAWVQTSLPPKLVKKRLSLVPTPVIEHLIEPVVEPVTTEPVLDLATEPSTQPVGGPVLEQHSNGQTATPPESVPSETSSGRLRAPRGGSSAAARLREARSRVNHAFEETGTRQTESNHAKAAVAEVHAAPSVSDEASEVTSAATEVSKAPKPRARARKAKVFDIYKGTSECLKVVEVARVPEAMPWKATVPSPAETETAEVPESGAASLAPEVPSVLRVELNHQNIDQAIPEITSPQRKKNSIYKNRTDKQRWKEALELAKGNKTKAKHIFAIELNREDMHDAVASDDKQEIERLKAQRRRRERELAISKGLPSPKRRVPTSFSSVSISKITNGDVDEEVIREDDWSTDEEERLQESRDEDYDEYDQDGDAIFSDGEEYADVEAELDGPRVEEVLQTPPLVKETLLSPAEESTPLPVKEKTPPERGQTPPPVKEKISRLVKETAPSPVEEQTPPAAAPVTASETNNGSKKQKIKSRPPPPPASETSAISRKQRKNRRKSRTSDATSSRQDSSVICEPPMAPPRKRKLADPPTRRLTREEAVAAHLAECKRKEELYLHNDDDDDDDESVASSS